ncbi:MAG TPA: CpsB/CapC family capsule biosynthesis tyrosine phosphatase [Tepidisphaeraceae bacterium]|jgi:protein-tyrosine phosphatase
MTGRIDVHAHLIPGVDDGCKTIEQSIECARALVSAGYTHAFCTPHVWPNYPDIKRDNVAHWTTQLQQELYYGQVPLTLLPGGELNLHPAVMTNTADYIVPYALANKYILCDIWCDSLPTFFEPAIRWLQNQHLTVILAHPERCKAVQDHPALADYFAGLGILLQGNLQCLSDPPTAATRQVAERYLKEGRYFVLGSDTHNPQSMPQRLIGLQNAIEMIGEAAVNQLTMDHPRKLLPSDQF